MLFMNPTVEPPHILDPGSCQAVRIEAGVHAVPAQMTMTREESEMKQLAYERQCKAWRKLVGVIDTNY
jgi:hypothetical protein